MPTTKDYYEILGVPRTATDKQLKAAYRRLARKYHPDLNKQDKQAEEKFKELAEAFAVLSDPEKRAKYDRGGHEAFGPGFDPFAGVDVGNLDLGVEDLASIFEMFGLGRGGAHAHRGRARAPRGGEDLHLELHIPLSQAIQGGTVEMLIPRRSRCATCGGSGIRPGSGEAPCTVCRGSGVGPEEQQRVKVRIPEGIEDGTTLRLPRQGHAGARGAGAGDVFLTVRVEPHPLLRRDGRDFTVEVPVGLARAALGGRVEVPTLDGTAAITIPPGTASGQRFRLKGRGWPASRGKPAGDLYAVIKIQPPKQLDERSRELLEEFARLNPVP